MSDLELSLSIWTALVPHHRVMLEIRRGIKTRETTSTGDTWHCAAMQAMIWRSVELRHGSVEILVAIQDTRLDIVAEDSKKKPNFARVRATHSSFRKDCAARKRFTFLKQNKWRVDRLAMPENASIRQPRPRGQRMSIQSRLTTIFVLLLCVVVTIGIFGVRQIELISSATHEIRFVALPKVLTVSEIERAMIAHAVMARRRVQTRDFEQQAAMTATMRAVERDFEGGLEHLHRELATPPEREIIAGILAHWDAYIASYQEVLSLSEQGASGRALLRLDSETQSTITHVHETLQQLVETTRSDVAEISAGAERDYRAARKLAFVAVLLGMGAVLAALVWIARGISTPLLQISRTMLGLIEGDDETNIPDYSRRGDEIGILARATTALRDSMLETRRLAEQVDHERKRLEATVRHMPVGLCMFNQSGQIVLLNKAFREMFGFADGQSGVGSSQREVLEAIGQLCDLPDPAAFVEANLLAPNQGQAQAAIWRLADQRSISIALQTTPDGWMIMVDDVTERVNAEQAIQRLARADSLTGLGNRLSFREEIHATLANSLPDRPVAVLFIDLDRFKHINDTLGHPSGDELLCQVARRLAWLVGEQDTVARLGGDEFAIIRRHDNQPEDALDLGRRVVTLLSDPFNIRGHSVQIGGSVGIALAPLHGDNPDEVQRNGDLALYAVKEEGKGHCRIFDQSMSDKQQSLHELEQALRTALLADAFKLHYQPLILIETGQVYGAEALLRWEHPTLGMISPARFVPLAEELGLIEQLGARVLEMSFRAAAAWPEEIRLSVNLSPRQFSNPEIAEDILSAAKAANFDPARLELEITEGVLLKQTDQTLQILHRLHDAGISIALDDFGTGYSSLRYLNAFPFDRVKIDASFVRSLPESEGSGAIVRAICSLCGSFGIAVTAEGIETAAQLDFIRNSGCSGGQGYYFARPMPETDFAIFLSRSGVGPARAASF